ncbi:MAG TPA: sensor histidine kinase [Burkholderiales bacterium]|nr:sensor histidine kinase [Burkholderiales bacterium]
MLSANLVLPIALVYVALLFAVAFVGDQRARAGRLGWLQSPVVYTLSISIYCTSWTFFGAVGSAARGGLEFATIYLGPTLVFVGWWLLLRKLVRIGHLHGVTSIADMISSRYGKNAPLAALATAIAVIGVTPYIALQLRAVTTSIQVISSAGPENPSGLPTAGTNFHAAFWIAAGMALFTILFGTRNVDAKEQHHGVVAAIALEAVVKLVALLAVGVLVVFGICDGIADSFSRAAPALLHGPDAFGVRWVAITFLSGVAVVCLPRQFQVTVVENADERHLRTASWLFPLYLFLITLFVLPIAISGLSLLPKGSNPDMFVLTLPMWAGHNAVALLAFLGGFSSATSMVIVACIALSTMVSNHLVMPLAMRFRWVRLNASGEVRSFLLRSRRVSICVLMVLGFLYFRFSGTGGALAAIGLISFAGVAQFVPSLVGGLFWRNANASGAMAGLATGAALWAYTLFLPSLGGGVVFSPELLRDGPFGVALLRPQALFGLAGLDPLVHSLFWSLSLNTLLFVLGSLAREPRPIERLQAALFVDVFRTPAEAASGLIRRAAAAEDLRVLAERILGADETRRLFERAAREQGLEHGPPIANDAFITQLERKLASSIGAASARAMISEAVSLETISLDELMQMADDTRRVREHSRQLQEKSSQLEAAASQLRDANVRLRRLDQEKDDFLSQVSHEVRTPMTSIRSFAQILLETPGLDPDLAQRYVRIIHDEGVRLTRLLDSTLDLSLLEHGEAPWPRVAIDPEVALERAVRSCQGLAGTRVRLQSAARARGVTVEADEDRLCQVFINLISNAIKYNTSDAPQVTIRSAVRDGDYEVEVADNGPGIRADERERIFSKFVRGWAHTQTGASGAGLGLAISGQIMRRLGGTLALVPGAGPGACFRVTLPLRGAAAAPGATSRAG